MKARNIYKRLHHVTAVSEVLAAANENWRKSDHMLRYEWYNWLFITEVSEVLATL